MNGASKWILKQFLMLVYNYNTGTLWYKAGSEND
jgi:hypothetical protein